MLVLESGRLVRKPAVAKIAPSLAVDLGQDAACSILVQHPLSVFSPSQ
jgi:hypothetical protein